MSEEQFESASDRHCEDDRPETVADAVQAGASGAQNAKDSQSEEHAGAGEASTEASEPADEDIVYEAEEILREAAQSEDETCQEEQITQDDNDESHPSELEQLRDDLARANASIYNLQQEYNAYVRRSKGEIPSYRQAGQEQVVEALLSVLDDIAAAREAGDLQDGPFAAIATKLETTLENRFKVIRYGEVGETFDPSLHDALMAQESEEVSEPQVKQVLTPGYMMNEKVLRPAKVMVANPA